MNWWGKLIGGTFGFMLGGPLGALLGAALGHQLDKGLLSERIAPTAPEADAERIQAAFFTATFSVMGHIAKVDGRVSEDEIEFAEAVMAHMELGADQRRVAIRLFREGKQEGFDLDATLDQFRRECHRRLTLLQMFLEIQLHAAYADGVLDATERQVLLHIFDRLGFSQRDFAHLEAMIRGAAHFGPDARPAPVKELLAEAYEVLGVEASASDGEVKRAYKRLMSQHHPDKLVAKGLPEEMMKLANEKTQEIKSAYDLIRKNRGL